MHPNGEEIVRGVQGALATHVLPELQSGYARSQMMIVQVLLGMAASEWDGAAQQLVDDNASLRALAARGADAVDEAGDDESLAGELRALAGETDASVRLSDLRANYEGLRAAIGRLAVLVEGSDAAALRALRPEVLGQLRNDLERRSLSLLGPRVDG